ncbi:dephospho-CoA kinase [Sphingomonas albertensis]|uniref:Dephospho-CoA kinase n=1 Tax=Sphingomonas albertensis TaxID=2762591 RepID=A0ABR7AJQ9_9SPHN|nr:dephospho-CoA kinase [Sphingomonas albertensis]MBC3940690.1 dephospho-CoA kinase [Sphingomonas albertensis]
MIIGLTGSIGMGKSTVAAMFADEGVPVFDADATVHRLQSAGGRLVPAIEAAFPGTTANGAVDRAKLGAAVFGNDAAIKRLEAIVHPAVGEERAAFLAEHAGKRVVFDVPLLFETGGDQRVDSIVVVSAAPDVQRARVLARSGMTPEKFAAILARQTPDAEKRARAHHVIRTDTSIDETRAQVRAVLASLEI